MEIKYDIPYEQVRNLTNQAQTELRKASHSYTNDIIDIAKQIELYSKAPGATSQVTETHIKHAVNKYASSPRKKKWSIFIEVFAELTIFVAGMMANLDYLTSGGIYFYVFLGVFATAIILAIVTRLN